MSGEPLFSSGASVEVAWASPGVPLKNRQKKGDKIDRNGTYKAGQRFDTGRFEAPIHPYNYPEELGPIPDFDIPSRFRAPALDPLTGAKNAYILHKNIYANTPEHGGQRLDLLGLTHRASLYRSLPI